MIRVAGRVFRVGAERIHLGRLERDLECVRVVEVELGYRIWSYAAERAWFRERCAAQPGQWLDQVGVLLEVPLVECLGLPGVSYWANWPTSSQ